MKKSLYEIGLSTGTDKATTHKYCEFYEKYINHLSDQNISLLEIGVWKGESLRSHRYDKICRNFSEY